MNDAIQFFINENKILFIIDFDQILDIKFFINVSNKDDNWYLYYNILYDF